MACWIFRFEEIAPGIDLQHDITNVVAKHRDRQERLMHRHRCFCGSAITKFAHRSSKERMAFQPIVADDLKPMPRECFAP